LTSTVALAFLPAILLAMVMDHYEIGLTFPLHIADAGTMLLFVEQKFSWVYTMTAFTPLFNVLSGMVVIVLFSHFSWTTYGRIWPDSADYLDWRQFKAVSQRASRSLSFRIDGKSLMPIALTEKPSLASRKSQRKSKGKSPEIDPNILAGLAQILIFLCLILVAIIDLVCCWLLIDFITDRVDELVTPDLFAQDFVPA
jgi:hypothetical protein